MPEAAGTQQVGYRDTEHCLVITLGSLRLALAVLRWVTLNFLVQGLEQS